MFLRLSIVFLYAILAPRVGAQCWTQRLLPPPGAETQRFAADIAFAADRMVVGAPSRSNVLGGSGVAYSYERAGSEWVLEEVIQAPAPNLVLFGRELATDGTSLAIADQDASIIVYQHNGTEWVIEQGIPFPFPIQEMAIAGDLLVVARAPTFGTVTTSIEVSERIGGTWTPFQQILAVPVDDDVGDFVRIDGDRILLSKDLGFLTVESTTSGWQVTGDEDVPIPVRGCTLVGDDVLLATMDAVEHFQFDGTDWVQQPPLLTYPIFSSFGLQLDHVGDTLFLTRPQLEGVRLYRFDYDGANWSYLGSNIVIELGFFSGTTETVFDGETLAVARGSNINANPAVTNVYVFDTTEPFCDAAIENFECSWQGGENLLTWDPSPTADSIEIWKDDQLLDVVEGSSEYYYDSVDTFPMVPTLYELRPVIAGSPCCGPFCDLRLPRQLFIDVAALPGGDGSFAAPFTTIAEGADNSQIGDILWVAPGEYTEEINLSTRAVTLQSLQGAELTTIRNPAGTAVFASDPNITIRGFTIRDTGARAVIATAPLRLEQCVFESCSGGAVEATIDLQVNRCAFRFNAASIGAALWMSAGTVRNSLFVENNALSNGGAISTRFPGTDPVIVRNCTFVENSGSSGGWELTALTGEMEISNCLFDEHLQPAATLYVGDVDGISLTHSMLRAGWVGEGNFSAEPGFVNPTSLDFQLNADSPARDSGYNEDIPAHERDFAGNPRVQGGNIDRGAFEFVDLSPQNPIPLTTVVNGPTVQLVWSPTNLGPTTVLRDDVPIATLAADVSGFSETLPPGSYTYRLRWPNTMPPTEGPTARAGIAGTWYVEVGSNGDGSMTSPFGSLQEAITAESVASGSTLLVAPGTYNGTVDLLGKDLRIVGIAGSSQTTLDALALDAVMLIRRRQTEFTQIEGLRVTGGMSNRTWGGGVVLENCRDVVVRDCRIDFNVVEGLILALGGGIGALGGRATIEGCVIDGNFSTAGALAVGGGIGATINAELTIRDCVLSANRALSNGSAISADNSSSVQLERCLVVNNLPGTALSAPAVSAPGNVEHCTIIDNGNRPAIGSADTLSIRNSIIVGGMATDSIGNVTNGPAVVTYSLVAGGFPGIGNIDADPLLDADYRLLPNSPCIDAGDPNSPLDPDGSVADIGAFGRVTFFLRGDVDNDNFFNGLSDSLYLLRFGFSNGAAPPCIAAADANGDGTINALNDSVYLLTFQFALGTPPPPPYPDCGALPQGAGLPCDVTACP